jgi:hypothetical protein
MRPGMCYFNLIAAWFAARVRNQRDELISTPRGVCTHLQCNDQKMGGSNTKSLRRKTPGRVRHGTVKETQDPEASLWGLGIENTWPMFGGLSLDSSVIPPYLAIPKTITSTHNSQVRTACGCDYSEEGKKYQCKPRRRKKSM